MFYSGLGFWAALVLGVMVIVCPAAAYYENNPPYQFQHGAFHHVPDNPLSVKDVPILIKRDVDKMTSKAVFYRIDLDNNGTQDVIVFSHPGKNRLADNLYIYLAKKKGGYRKITFLKDAAAGIEDVVDVNKDGKWELILADQCGNMKRNYLAYSIYRFKNYRLVNADTRFKGFPKFVWFTHKHNDKDSMHLSAQTRQRHVRKKNAKIIYSDIQ